MNLVRLFLVLFLAFWPLGVAHADTETPTPSPVPTGTSTPFPTPGPSPTATVAPGYHLRLIGSCSGTHAWNNEPSTFGYDVFNDCYLTNSTDGDIQGYMYEWITQPDSTYIAREGWYNNTVCGNDTVTYSTANLRIELVGWGYPGQALYRQGSGAQAWSEANLDLAWAQTVTALANTNGGSFNHCFGFRNQSFVSGTVSWAFNVYEINFGVPPVEVEPEVCQRDTVAMTSNEGGGNYVLFPYDWTLLQAEFVEDTWLIFETGSVFCAGGLACEVYDYPIGSNFVCGSFSGSTCSSGVWTAIPYACSEGTGVGELDDVIPQGVTFGQVGFECLSFYYDDFDLSTLSLSVFLTTFDIAVPDWGWVAGSWVMCLDLYEFDELMIGDTDFRPMVEVVLTMLSLSILGFFIRR